MLGWHRSLCTEQRNSQSSAINHSYSSTNIFILFYVSCMSVIVGGEKMNNNNNNFHCYDIYLS